MSTYRIVSWVYPFVPLIAALVAAMAVRRSKSVAPMRAYLRTCALGTVLGIGVVVLYTVGFGGAVSTGQAAVTCWWATAALCIIQAFNLAVDALLTRIVRLRSGEDNRPCCAAAGVAASVTRAVLVFAAGVAYLSAVGISYRPRVRHAGDPLTMLSAPFESVRFSATDGVRLAAWWIPACHTARTDGHPAHEWAQDTVILCPGLGADKASQLLLVRDLVPNGYNVLALDFRAHGESDGHFSTFGDLERRDVLGAVRWVRTHHADEARRILGLGVNTGAAALVGAAADSSPEGQAIDAVAVFEPFDDLSSLVTRISEDHVLPLPGWAAVHLALPIAGAQLGTMLGQWSPRHDIQSLWPRPLLVIEGETDPLFPSSSARSFYDAAQEPKYGYWPEKTPRDKLLFSDKRASLMVRIFFGSAREMI